MVIGDNVQYRPARERANKKPALENVRKRRGEEARWLWQQRSERLPDAEHSAQLRKAVIASTVGTAIEWYDFFLYGTAAGLVFGKLFFPNQDALSGTLLAFGTYFIGFAARPVGAAIFGHYGDRIGRKATLIATLLFMGLATFAIAFVPTYDSIGIWGAVILTVLRALQGIGVGGEWGGSVLLSMEWSRTHGQRGLVAVVAAIRRPLRTAALDARGHCLQLMVGQRLPGLGLAHSIRAFDHPGRESVCGFASAFSRRRCSRSCWIPTRSRRRRSSK